YAINLLAVPALALSGNWPVAAVLIVTERFGKAVRSPAKDVILSHPASQIGRGWGFGVHEAMDQLGALAGPLIVAGVLLFNGNYRTGFAVLLIPAVLAICVLLVARFEYPEPDRFEKNAFAGIEMKGFPRVYWIYLAGVVLVAAAYADFALISYHFQSKGIVGMDMIPVFYAVAMAVDAVAALAFGRLFDRAGIHVLAIPVALSAFFAPLVFMGGFWTALLGMIAWGVGLGAQESIMRAAIAELIPTSRRGTAYGVFNLGFGVFWFLGSALMGILYDTSILYLVGFSVVLQLAAIPIFLSIRKPARYVNAIKA
ncbi:MAG TPA: MFS transporter, partial [Methanocella sp.]|nr:MFS transporter [Methanocella sp.]